MGARRQAAFPVVGSMGASLPDFHPEFCFVFALLGRYVPKMAKEVVQLE
jgi:hypothetical protein